MITPSFIIDGVRINEESLRNIPSNNRIMAIKYLRYVSGMSLKEAKDAIENNCCIYDGTSRFYTLDYGKLIAFFQTWLKPIPTQEEIEASISRKAVEDYIFEQNQIVVNRKHKLLKAFQCAIENSEVLGYKTDIDACQAILNNFKNLSLFG